MASNNLTLLATILLFLLVMPTLALANDNTQCEATTLPEMAIHFLPRDMQFLEEHNAQALKYHHLVTNGFLEVPGTLDFEGKTYDVSVRLAGNHDAHRNAELPTMRIHLLHKKRIFGTHTFKILYPKVRGYYYEPLYYDYLQHLGLLSIEYRFVQFSFNGRPTMPAGVELPANKEHLGINGPQLRGESIGKAHTKYKANTGSDSFNWHGGGVKVSGGTFDKELKAKAVGLIRAMQEGLVKPSQAFDVDDIAKYLAVSELWRTSHAVSWGDIRFYYDPVHNRLRTLSEDAVPSFQFYPGGPFWIAMKYHNSFSAYLLDDPVVFNKTIETIKALTTPPEWDKQLAFLNEKESGYRKIFCYLPTMPESAVLFLKDRAAALQSGDLHQMLNPAYEAQFYPRTLAHSIRIEDPKPKFPEPAKFPIFVYAFTYVQDGQLIIEFNNPLPSRLGHGDHVIGNRIHMSQVVLKLANKTKILLSGESGFLLEEGKSLRFALNHFSEQDRVSVLKGSFVGALDTQTPDKVYFKAIPYYPPAANDTGTAAPTP